MKQEFKPIYIFLPFLIVFTVWLLMPGLNGPFLFDDWQVLVHADWAADQGAWFLGYRPLRNLSYIIDLFFGKMEPFTFHVSNLIYHLLNIILFAFLAKLIIQPKTHDRWILLMGICIIFAVHPVQIESVVYISGRRDLLFSFFYLAGLLFFFKTYQSRRFGLARRSGLAWAGVLIFTLLATGSKESGITLPVAAFIFKPWIITFPEKDIVKKNMAGWALYPTIVILISGLLLLLVYTIGMAMPVLKTGLMGNNLFFHLVNCCIFIFRYFYIAVWPQNLAVDNSVQSFEIISHYGNIGGLLALLVVSSFSGICLAVRFGFFNSRLTKDPDFVLVIKGWLWFMIIILPMSNIIPHVERFAVHYLYLPIPGIFMIIWGILSGIFKTKFRGKLAPGILILVLTFGFSAKTRYELQWWEDDLVFWEHTTSINPDCARAQTNYGMTLLEYNKKQKAFDAFNKSLVVQPSSYAYLGLSSIALDDHDLQKAKECLIFVQKSNHLLERHRLFIEGSIALAENRQNKALEIGNQLCRTWPNYDAGYFLRAKLATAQKKNTEAIALFKKSLTLPGHHTRNYLGLIRVLIKAKQWEQALIYLDKGFESGLWTKDDANRLNDKAFTLDMLGQTKKAIDFWFKSLESDSACLIAALNLSSAFFRQKKYTDIIALQNQVSFSQNADNDLSSRLLNNVGLAYIHINQLDKARTIMEKALELWPDNQDVVSNLKRLKSMQ
ncbi:MAG: hypothetical protein H8D87_00165 [Deltaproteobacteria bacterium]|nr:hypothetical protein [Candidatus Desulfobacula maris]